MQLGLLVLTLQVSSNTLIIFPKNEKFYFLTELGTEHFKLWTGLLYNNRLKQPFPHDTLSLSDSWQQSSLCLFSLIYLSTKIWFSESELFLNCLK